MSIKNKIIEADNQSKDIIMEVVADILGLTISYKVGRIDKIQYKIKFEQLTNKVKEQLY